MASEPRKKKNYPIDPEEIRKRGNRLKTLRKLLRYSTLAFSEQCETKESTFKSWEQGRFTGLTATGALRVIEACQKEGVTCTLEWLLHGKGLEPTKNSISQEVLAITKDSSSPITQELLVFHKLHPNAIDTIVGDDSMEPVFSKGDYVAGIRCFDKDIKKLMGLNCIVQLQTGEIIVRTLQAGEQPDFYTLSNLNLNTTIELSNFKNIKLFSAANIIWIRKPENVE